MYQGKRWIFGLSALFHACYLFSIFDIYFVSPIVSVQTRFKPEIYQRPAKRTVLIVGDGLRADKLLQQYPTSLFTDDIELPIEIHELGLSTLDVNCAEGYTSPGPFLRGLVTSGNASWGISHTRVPTESRPGHVALLGGLYEDVSAVTKGWKHNPVNFDSIVNQSTHAYVFGSPDIVTMFRTGATEGKVQEWSYSGADEDFTADAVQLDTWVMQQFSQFLKNASTSPSAAEELAEEGNVFFFHLLGIDTTGHAYRPHSKEYYRNIVVVDYVVRALIQEFKSYFKDEDTAYVFTADHGMSARGNHGDGHPDNTRTPIIAWGAGVSSHSAEIPIHDDYSQDWNLGNQPRWDMEQADVATLLSALSGNAFPANNVGRLPLQYLAISEEHKAKIAQAHMRQLAEQYVTKRDLKRNSSIRFRPYTKLDVSTGYTLDERLQRVSADIAEADYDNALKTCSETVDVILDGLRYYQRYDWRFLRALVAAGYASHALFIATILTSSQPFEAAQLLAFSFNNILGASVFAILAGILATESAPFTYYLYAFFPSLFLSQSLAHLASRGQVWRRSITSGDAYQAVLCGIGLEATVFGYTHRWIWSFGFIVIGLMWLIPTFTHTSTMIKMLWSLCCWICAIFTGLDVDKAEDIRLIILAAAGFTAVGVYSHSRATSHTAKSLVKFQIPSILINTALAAYSASRIANKAGLPAPQLALNWITVVSTTLLPGVVAFKYHIQPMERLRSLILAFANIYLFLSISYEAVFYLMFSITLLVWIDLEIQPEQQASSPISSLARLGLLFLFWIHYGFFGAQNVASISSFYLEPVYRLVPVFNPFAMSALLLLKILIPFMVVSSATVAVTRGANIDHFSLFLVTLIMTDVLSLNFFFLVTDEGSWLEIGQSISHFVIASLLGIFEIVLLGLGNVIMQA